MKPATPRLLSLDVLRGVALFGIFQVNVQLFALPLAALSRPTLAGPLEGLDRAAWVLTHGLFEWKFITLFSVLFGASLALAKPSAREFWSRQLWLLVFGLLHAWLVWFGDILVTYAVAGWFAWRAREWPVPRLVRFGVALFCVPLLTLPLLELSLEVLPGELRRMAQEGFSPSAEAMARELAANRGPWVQQLVFRAGQTSEGEAFVPFLHLWRAAGCMVLGVALVRVQLFAGAREDLERRLVAWGLGLGLPLTAVSAAVLSWAEFPVSAALTLGLINYVASLPLALGLLGLGLQVVRRRGHSTPVQAVAATGRLALTNYLGQSFIATLLFYGVGLGLHGRVARWQLVPLAATVWLGQVLLSHVWERCFGRGPFERAWRGLARLTAGDPKS